MVTSGISFGTFIVEMLTLLHSLTRCYRYRVGMDHHDGCIVLGTISPLDRFGRLKPQLIRIGSQSTDDSRKGSIKRIDSGICTTEVNSPRIDRKSTRLNSSHVSI